MSIQSVDGAYKLHEYIAEFYTRYLKPPLLLSHRAKPAVGIDVYEEVLRHLGYALNINTYLFDQATSVEDLRTALKTLYEDNQCLQAKLKQKTLENQAFEKCLEKYEGKPDLPEEISLNDTPPPSGDGLDGAVEGVALESTPFAQPPPPSAHEEQGRNAVAKQSRKTQAPTRNYTIYPSLPPPSATLLQFLLQGQRNFLDQHNDVGIAAALSFLIQHALTQLQAPIAPQHQTLVRRAMYANLFTISKKLSRHRGHRLVGFQSAAETLEAEVPGVDEFATRLPMKKEKRSEAKIFQETLKLLRDRARLDFRPYFYEVDLGEKAVFTLG